MPSHAQGPLWQSDSLALVDRFATLGQCQSRWELAGVECHYHQQITIDCLKVDLRHVGGDGTNARQLGGLWWIG